MSISSQFLSCKNPSTNDSANLTSLEFKTKEQCSLNLTRHFTLTESALKDVLSGKAGIRRIESREKYFKHLYCQFPLRVLSFKVGISFKNRQ